MPSPENPYASPTSDADSPDPVGTDLLPGQLRLVYVGLSLVYWGIIVMILGAFAMIGGAMFAGGAAGLGAAPPGGPMFVSLGGLAAIGVGALLNFIGPFFCLTVPRETNCLKFIVASIVLQAVNYLFAPLALFVGIPIILSNFVVYTSGVAAIAMFVMFLARLASYLGHEKISKQARNVLIAGAILMVVVWAITIPATAEIILGAIGVLIGLVLLIYGLVVFVMYVNLVNAVRKAVKLQMQPPGERGESHQVLEQEETEITENRNL